MKLYFSFEVYEQQIQLILLLMYSSKEIDGHKYTLPNGMATSGNQLKILQQKLLQNHYQNYNDANQSSSQNNWPVERQQAVKNDKYSQNNLSKEDLLRVYQAQSKFANDKQKNTLSGDLLAQMEYKNVKKQYQRFQTLEEEAKLIKHTQKFDSLQKQKMKQFNNKYKMEAQEDLQMKQNKREKQFQEKQNQKEFYKNTYNFGIPRSQSVGNLGQNRSYVNPTKQYYNEIEQAMRTRNPSNPQLLKRNSSFKITNDDTRVQRTNMYSSSLNQHYAIRNDMLQSLKEKQTIQKQDLRQVLLTQIREKEQAKLQRRRDYQIPYASKDYKFIHHPINNPIDFKHAHDNHYVLGELKSAI